MILLLLVAQAAAAVATPAATSAPTAQSWSILDPVAKDGCVKGQDERPDDILVCGRATPVAKLPYPELRTDQPRPVNRDATGMGALAAENTPCAAVQKGCTTGVDVFGMGTAAVRLIQKVVAPSSCCEAPGEGTNIALLGKDVVGGVGKAFRKKADKSARVPIPLDDAPPVGKVLP